MATGPSSRSAADGLLAPSRVEGVTVAVGVPGPSSDSLGFPTTTASLCSLDVIFAPDPSALGSTQSNPGRDGRRALTYQVSPPHPPCCAYAQKGRRMGWWVAAVPHEVGWWGEKAPWAARWRGP